MDISSCPPKHELKQRLARLFRAPGANLAASVVIPVNAQADLQKVLYVLEDVAADRGQYAFEIILVINNYLPDLPPQKFTSLKISACR